jgi:hypothetical protein
MNYELEIQKSIPAVFNNFDGALPPLVAGSGSASLVTNAYTASFLAFNRDRKDQPFTLEVWHLPTQNDLIIGHPDEGVLYEDGDYILRMNFTTGPAIEGRWTAPEEKARHIVVTYDGSRFSLYVDAVNVIALDVPDTNFAANGLPITTGLGIYDSLALYYRVLTVNDIQVHYSWGHDTMSFTDIASAKGGGTYTLAFEDVDVLETITFESEFDSDTWEAVIPVEGVTPGVYLSWVGHGVTVSYTIDDTTWTPVDNRSTIVEDVDLTNTFLVVRVHLEDESAELETLKAYLLADRVMQPMFGVRNITFAGASFDETPGHQLDYQTDQGANIRGGYIQIEADPSGAHAHGVRTIEMWAKTSQAIILSEAVQTVYTNGVQAATYNGHWAHYVFVLSASTLGPVRIGEGQTLSIGSLATYSEALTASKVSKLYNLNIGAPAFVVNDSGHVTVAETDPAVDIYAYTWSVASA